MIITKKDSTEGSFDVSLLATGRFNLNDKVSLFAEALLGSNRTDAQYAAPAQAFSLSPAQIAT
jgi:hypothetical protein